jgi:23S rRNA pseudouridine1911/1915/1917 synthase
MPVVPDSSGDFSLLDWGKAYLKESRDKKGNVFLGVVHRIDRPVSGIVCFAVTSKAASRLSDQMRRRVIKKTYIGLSDKRPPGMKGRLEHWLLKDRRENRVTLFDKPAEGAKKAVTSWKYKGVEKGFHKLLLFPETGRPHQLRAQCAAMGCPLAGDAKYGSRHPFARGAIGLHALGMDMVHPVKKIVMKFRTTCDFRHFPIST